MGAAAVSPRHLAFLACMHWSGRYLSWCTYPRIYQTAVMHALPPIYTFDTEKVRRLLHSDGIQNRLG